MRINALPDLKAGNASQFLGHFGSHSLTVGARVEQVDEHPDRTCATFIFELEEYPEAKSLSPADLKVLYARVSTDQQSTGLESQVRILKDYCEKNDIKNY